MKTDVYRFSKDNFDIRAVSSVVSKIAEYNKLGKKQEMRLALLSEELAEMIPNLLKYGNGEFYIENDGNNYSIKIKVNASDMLDWEQRDKIISVSSSGKNAAAVGILNKIRVAAETMLADYSVTENMVNMSPDYSNNFYNMGMDINPISHAQLWTLDKYKIEARSDEKAWDELEKSVIANLADDVTVGIIKGSVEITVKKAL